MVMCPPGCSLSPDSSACQERCALETVWENLNRFCWPRTLHEGAQVFACQQVAMSFALCHRVPSPAPRGSPENASFCGEPVVSNGPDLGSVRRTPEPCEDSVGLSGHHQGDSRQKDINYAAASVTVTVLHVFQPALKCWNRSVAILKFK